MADRVIWPVKVPGAFYSDVTFLDLETVKVSCDYVFPGGEKLGRRWSAFMAGLASEGRVTILERGEGSEEAFLGAVFNEIGPPRVMYAATRKFDEMILKGRFTYARRSPAPEPFYPAMPGAEDLDWDQRKPDEEWYPLRAANRELASAEVSAAYYRRGRHSRDLALVHNFRDVVWMIGAYGIPDAECAAWCRHVLTDYRFAESMLFGKES